MKKADLHLRVDEVLKKDFEETVKKHSSLTPSAVLRELMFKYVNDEKNRAD